MSKINKLCCLHLPLHNIKQKIYDLSPNFCFALIDVKILEPKQLQFHIKLVEKETNRFICMDKVSLSELIKQLQQFESPDIKYPCNNTFRNIGLIVKMTTNPGEYQLVYEKNKKMILDPATVKYIFIYESIILNAIRDMECQHIYEGYDVVG